MALRFEWDPAKDAANTAKHGVSFAEARSLFTSGLDYLEIWDEAHSEQEERYIAIGPTARGIVVVSYTVRQEDVIRLISARAATSHEMVLFRQHLRAEQ